MRYLNSASKMTIETAIRLQVSHLGNQLGMGHAFPCFHDANNRRIDDVLSIIVDFVSCFLPFRIRFHFRSNGIDLYTK